MRHGNSARARWEVILRFTELSSGMAAACNTLAALRQRCSRPRCHPVPVTAPAGPSPTTKSDGLVITAPSRL